MNIACTIDGSYIVHCAIMLRSLWEENQDTEINVFIIHAGMPLEQQQELQNYLVTFLKNIQFLQLDLERFSGFPVNRHISKATYFRLLLGDTLPSNVKKVLFLDSDITIHGKLDTLWKTDLQNFVIAAVESPDSEANKKRLLLDPSEKYFNAGVLLIDVDAWREANLFERGKEFVKEFPDRIRWWDQDVLNHLLRNHWLCLPACWNHLDNYSSSKQAGAKIVHYAGEGMNKPWNYACWHPDRGTYRRIKKQTPWANIPLEGSPNFIQRCAHLVSLLLNWLPPKSRKIARSLIFKKRKA